jgi:hypothetical protein
MLLVAVAHAFAYSYHEFRSQQAKAIPLGQKVRAVMSTQDFVTDVKNTFLVKTPDYKKAQ